MELKRYLKVINRLFENVCAESDFMIVLNQKKKAHHSIVIEYEPLPLRAENGSKLFKDQDGFSHCLPNDEYRSMVPLAKLISNFFLIN